MPDKSAFILRYRKDEDTWMEFLLKDRVVIGSGPDCDLVVADSDFSPRHVLMQIDAEKIQITDLSSSQETKIEGRPLPPGATDEITSGQSFYIGRYIFTLFKFDESFSTMKMSLVDEDEPPPPPVPDEESLVRIPDISVEGEKIESPDAVIEEPEDATGFQKAVEWVLSKAVIVGGGLLAVAIVTAIIIIAVLANRKVEQLAVGTATMIPGGIQADATAAVEPTVETEPTKPFEPAMQPTTIQNLEELEITPPGLGDITINPISIISGETSINDLWTTIVSITPDEAINVATDIVGENVGYVYSYVGLYQDTNGDKSITTIEMNYLGGKTTKDIDGVTYPDWGDDGTIPIDYDWDPAVNFISDGTNSTIALIYPVEYSTQGEADILAVDSYYIPSGGGDKRFARMYFDNDGEMTEILGFKQGGDILGAPFEIIPHAGDRFIILLERFVFDERQFPVGEESDGESLPYGLGDVLEQHGGELPYGLGEFLESEDGQLPFGKGHFTKFEGGELVYSKEGFTWYSDDSYLGDFVLGIVVEDLDGGFFAAYAPIIVK